MLNSLAENWQENASQGLNYRLVRETVKQFSIVNSKLNRGTPGYDACVKACEVRLSDLILNMYLVHIYSLDFI